MYDYIITEGSWYHKLQRNPLINAMFFKFDTSNNGYSLFIFFGSKIQHFTLLNEWSTILYMTCCKHTYCMGSELDV